MSDYKIMIVDDTLLKQSVKYRGFLKIPIMWDLTEQISF